MTSALAQLNDQLQPHLPLNGNEPYLVAEEIVGICVEDNIPIDAELKRQFIDAYGDWFLEAEDLWFYYGSGENYKKFLEMPTL